MQQYQRFVDELAPRLETARALERQLDAHLARRFNVFDYLRRDELGLSRIVADLLNPEGKHRQGAIFLKLLLDGCGLKDYAPLGSTARPAVEVEVEKEIKGRRLDICAFINGYCLAIENKPYAGDQPSQVRDYLSSLRDLYSEKCVLIYLSRSGEPPSPESLELADLDDLPTAANFKIMPYYSAEESEWGDGFDNWRQQYTLADWFSDCRRGCNAERLWWFLREAEEFCKRRFGGIAMASSELETINEFVLSDEKNWKTALAVHRVFSQVVEKVFYNFMDLVWRAPWEVKVEGPDGTGVPWVYPDTHAGWRRCFSPNINSYLSLYDKNWRSSADAASGHGRRKFTQIRFEAEEGVDGWFYGVASVNEELTDENATGCKDLRKALTDEFGASEAPKAGWVWWKWVDPKWRDWTPIAHILRRECDAEGDERGEATAYFADKLAHIASIAMPIIDLYEGSSAMSS